MELPFAVESPDRMSQLLPDSTAGDDGSSLVTTSSQGSFLGSSSGTGGFATGVPTTVNPNFAAHMNPTNNANMGMRPAVISSPPIVAPLPPTSQRPTSTSGGGLTSLNIFGALRVPSVLSSKPKAPPTKPAPTETIDFTYVNVCETDADEVDITIDGHHAAMDGLHGNLGDDYEAMEQRKRGDILALLLSGTVQQETNEDLVVSFFTFCRRLFFSSHLTSLCSSFL